MTRGAKELRDLKTVGCAPTAALPDACIEGHPSADVPTMRARASGSPRARVLRLRFLLSRERRAYPRSS